MQTLDHDSTSITIDAPARVVFDLVTDIRQMTRFSPELVSCRWLDGATRPAVGARFEAVNQVPGQRPWKNRPVVTTYEPHHTFAISRTEPFAGTLVWQYELSNDGRRTVLSESYEVTRPISRIGWLIIEKGFGGLDRRGDLERGMRETLQAIKNAAEAAHRPVG
jgi:hypothetical protein